MKGSDYRFPWYLIPALVIGIGLGLWVAWVISPVAYTDVSPAGLSASEKSKYRILAAQAYSASGNLTRGQARLQLLGEGDPARALAAQAQMMIANGGAVDDARALALMAAAFGQQTAAGIPSAQPISTSTSNESKQTIQPTASAYPSVTAAVPAQMETQNTPESAQKIYTLKESKNVCDKNATDSLLMVEVDASAGTPVRNVEVFVTWQNGEDRFVTGMKPDISPGYADFKMQPGVLYTLRVVGSDQPLMDLKASQCQTDSGREYWSSIRTVYIQK